MKMPGKIAVVIVLLLVSIAIDTLVQLKAESLETSYVIVVAIRGLLVLGLIKGSEGARMILNTFALIGLFFSGIGLVTLLLATGGSAPAMAYLSGLIGVSANGFMLYALADKGVQAWMFSRSVGGDVEAE